MWLNAERHNRFERPRHSIMASHLFLTIIGDVVNMQVIDLSPIGGEA
jgi:hypothetical protein